MRAITDAAHSRGVAERIGPDPHTALEPAPPLAVEATLSALTLSGVTLNESFASGRTNYTADVANSVATTRVTATAAHSGATLTVDGVTAASGVQTGPISLNLGSNTITVVVTAEDGTTMETYTMVVTRAAPTSVTNNPPGFSGPFTFTVAENAATVGTVTATDDDDGDRVTSYQLIPSEGGSLFQIDEETGELTFNKASEYRIIVKAQSGEGDRAMEAQRTYTVRVTMTPTDAPDTPDGPSITGIGLDGPPGTSDYYVTHETIRVDVRFNGPLGPATNPQTADADTPNLKMIGGGAERTVTNCFRIPNGGANNVLRCRYTVGVGEVDRDGVSFPANALSLPPGVALHAAGDASRAAVLSPGAVADIADGRVNAGPGAPRNLRLTAGDGRIRVEWDPPAEPGDPPVDAYRVYLREGSSGTWIGGYSRRVEGTRTAFENLTNGQPYQVRVEAVSSKGLGPSTPPQTATPVPDASPPLPRVPSAPRSLTLDAGNGRITAAWVAPADPGNPALYGYWIRYRAAGTDEWQYWAQDGTTTVTVISGLTNEETYEVQVAAVNDEGVGAYTGVRRATPQESNRGPGAPRNLNVTAGDRKITVSWSAPEDMGIPALYAYQGLLIVDKCVGSGE